MPHRPRTWLLMLAATGLAAAFACGCGGSSPAPAGSPAGSPAATTSPRPTAEPSPPASMQAPILGLGEPAAFFLPDGSTVTVAADEFTDPGSSGQGLQAGAGERLVSLKLVVRAEAPDGAAGDTVTLAFKESSLLLVAADDSLYVPPAAAAELYDGPWETASSVGFALPFVVPDTARLVRFVCTPNGDVTPRSATWLLK